MHGRIDGYMDAHIDAGMDACRDGCHDGWMLNGRMLNGWAEGTFHPCKVSSAAQRPSVTGALTLRNHTPGICPSYLPEGTAASDLSCGSGPTSPELK